MKFLSQKTAWVNNYSLLLRVKDLDYWYFKRIACICVVRVGCSHVYALQEIVMCAVMYNLQSGRTNIKHLKKSGVSSRPLLNQAAWCLGIHSRPTVSAPLTSYNPLASVPTFRRKTFKICISWLTVTGPALKTSEIFYPCVDCNGPPGVPSSGWETQASLSAKITAHRLAVTDKTVTQG